jgi:hypothetical protein
VQTFAINVVLSSGRRRLRSHGKYCAFCGNC